MSSFLFSHFVKFQVFTPFTSLHLRLSCLHDTVLKLGFNYCLVDYINNRTEKEVMKMLTFFYSSAYACYQNTELKFCPGSVHVQSGNPSPDAASEVDNANCKSFAYIRQLFHCPYFQHSCLTQKKRNKQK